MADCLARELQHGEVDEQRGADRAEEEPEPAEQMQRAVAVTTHEPHGQEVEKPPEVALHPIARLPVLTGSVVHGQLADPVAAVVCEHGQEPVKLAVDPEVPDHVGSVGLEPAVQVVEAQPGHAPHDPVEDPRGDPTRQRVAPVRLPARDEIEALVEFGEQARDLGWIVLEIGVDRHHHVAGGVAEPGRESGCFPEVPAQADDLDVPSVGMDPSQRCERAVRRAVVDEDSLPAALERVERGAKLLVEWSYAPLFVVHRNDDADHSTSLCAVVATLLSLEEAQARILERVVPLPSERVPLEAAAGRVLAEPATASVDLPPFDSSAMDGFAVRSADTPGRLPVVARIAAGRPAPRELRAGEAMAIATGGTVPGGADAVIPIEYVVDHDNDVEIPQAVDAGANVRPTGGDLRRGEAVVAAGTVLGAAQIGALAAAGVPDITSARRPRTAVLATGSELRPPGSNLRPGEIYDANGVILATQLVSAGAEVERLEPVADDEAAHRRALEVGLRGDLLVSSGGVSVGPHDLVRSVGAELGVEEVFWGVAVKPGKPLWFGVRDRTLVFGVPGNPVSALVCFELFVRPAVLALQGVKNPLPRFEPGTLAQGVRRNPVRTELVRARSRVGENAVEVEPLSGQESHMIARAAGADVLVLVPAGDGELAAGAAVSFLRLA